MDELPAIDPRERYHRFQCALIESHVVAERMVTTLIETYREQCADVLIHAWVEPIAYCLLLRDNGFSIKDEESQFIRHEIKIKAQAVGFDVYERLLHETSHGKEILDLFTLLKRRVSALPL